MIRGALLALALAVAAATPAAAHKLKVFATVKGEAVTGYAFFIGGGRSVGTPWTAKSGDDAEIAAGETGEDGGFRFVPPQPVTAAITVTVDTREGHIASATQAPSRFGTAAEAPPASPTATGLAAPPPAAGNGEPPAVTAETAALIEAAVQHQVAPLLERIEAMDDRLRLTDVMSGIFLIVGLAGIGLWARSRGQGGGRRP